MKISDLRQTEIVKLSVETRSQLLRESVDKAIEDEEIYMRVCDRCESKDRVRECSFVFIAEKNQAECPFPGLAGMVGNLYAININRCLDLCHTCAIMAEEWIKSFDRTFDKDLDPRMPQEESEG